MARKRKAAPEPNPAHLQLQAFIERIEAHEGTLAEIKAQASQVRADIRAEYVAAVKGGYDRAMMKEMLADRRMTAAARAERDSLREIYRAALGMLGDLPLGVAAIRRVDGDNYQAAGEANGNDVVPPTPEMIDEARATGRSYAQGGHPIGENPFKLHDPRRAAFEEAWIQEQGKGNEPPPSWRRPEPAEPQADLVAGAPDQGQEEGLPEPERSRAPEEKKPRARSRKRGNGRAPANTV